MNKTVIPIQNVSPYIRYVNDFYCPAGIAHNERIIFDCEFMFCLGGEGHMRYDTKEYTLRRGDLFYLSPVSYTHLDGYKRQPPMPISAEKEDSRVTIGPQIPTAASACSPYPAMFPIYILSTML